MRALYDMRLVGGTWKSELTDGDDAGRLEEDMRGVSDMIRPEGGQGGLGKRTMTAEIRWVGGEDPVWLGEGDSDEHLIGSPWSCLGEIYLVLSSPQHKSFLLRGSGSLSSQ